MNRYFYSISTPTSKEKGVAFQQARRKKGPETGREATMHPLQDFNLRKTCNVLRFQLSIYRWISDFNLSVVGELMTVTTGPFGLYGGHDAVNSR
jgi:hypothetical protein